MYTSHIIVEGVESSFFCRDSENTYYVFFSTRRSSMAVREATYQKYLIDKLKNTFPGCMILKNDPQYLQGVPDLLVLYNQRWAMLEVKPSPRARVQPNQTYYVELFDEMSFGAFINPDNEEEILYELQHAFEA
jgi:predicted ATP-binding protein involved in virulence